MRAHLKITYIILNILFILSLLSIPVVNEYQVSIYEDITLYMIVVFVFIMLNLLVVLFERKVTIYEVVTIFVVLISVYSIQLIKNYQFNQFEDPMTHIGLIKDILKYGHSEREVIYPVFHIFLAEMFFIVSGNLCELSKLYMSTNIILDILSIIFLYIFIRNRLSELKNLHLAYVVSVVPLYTIFSIYSNFTPYAMSVFIFPFALYIHNKKFNNRNLKYTLILIITLAFYLFLNILAFYMILLYILLTVCFSRQVKLADDLILSTIMLVSWLIQHREFNILVIALDKLFSGKSSISELSVYSSLAYKLDLVELLRVIIISYGVYLIFFIFSVIYIIMFFRINKQELKSFEINDIFYFIIINFFVVILLFSPIILPFSGLRFLNYLLPMGVVFFVKSVILLRRKFRLDIFVMIILVIIVLIGILNVYHSPQKLMPNQQITQDDLMGMKWILDHKDPKSEEYIVGYSQLFRYADYLYGYKYRMSREDMKLWYNYPYIKDHLNYSNYDKIEYIKISKFEKVLYETVWKKVGRLNVEDIQRAESSEFFREIYDNRNTSIYVFIPKHLLDAY